MTLASVLVGRGPEHQYRYLHTREKDGGHKLRRFVIGIVGNKGLMYILRTKADRRWGLIKSGAIGSVIPGWRMCGGGMGWEGVRRRGASSWEP